MTTTARIPATKSVANYDDSIAAGAQGHFMAHSMNSQARIIVMAPNAAGDYEQITYLDEDGKQRKAELRQGFNSISLRGPIDFRFAKEATTVEVELSEYT